MPINVVLYSDDRRLEWDAFVDSSINGTFLHNRAFFDSNPLNALDDHSLMFYNAQKLIALLPGTLKNDEGQRSFSSHNRSTYGGFVIQRNVGVSDAVSVVEALVHHLRSNQVATATIRNPFRFLYEQISDEFEYAMWYHGFTVMSRELEVFIDLLPGFEIVRARYHNTARRNSVRARRDVEVRINDYSYLESFWKMLERNLTDRHSTKPIHSFVQILSLIELIGEKNFAFATGLHNGKLVAGCLMFIPRSSVLHSQYVAQDYQWQHLRPVNAVIDAMIEWGCRNKFRGLNLGTANEGGYFFNKGLFRFKEGFGGRSVLRETHQLIIAAQHD